MERLWEITLKMRKLMVAFVVIASLLSIYILKDIKIMSDITKYLPESDEAVRLFNKVGEEFGTSYSVMVGIETEDIFSPDVIDFIKELTNRLYDIDGVTHVVSLTNIMDIKKVDDGLEITRLIPDEYDERMLKDIRNYALSKDIYVNKVVSQDGKAALILINIDNEADKSKVVEEIKREIKSKKFKGRIYIGGVPTQIYEGEKLILKDLKVLTPLVLIIIVSLLLLFFRINILHVIAALLPVLLSSLYIMALMVVLKKPITVVSDIIPVILMSVGIAYPIHMIDHFLHSRTLKEAIKRAGVPILMAGLTTAIGFISFIFGSYLVIIKDFGIFSSIGITISMLLSLMLTPLILRRRGKAERERSGFLKRLTEAISNMVVRRGFIPLLTVLLLIPLFVYGTFRIKRSSNLIDYFKRGTSIRKTTEFLQEKFKGSIPLQVYIETDFYNPYALMEVERIRKFLESMEYVVNSQSITSLLTEMNYVMGEGRCIPEEEEKVANLFFFIEGEEASERFINYERDKGIVMSMLTTFETDKGRFVVDTLNSFLKDTLFYIVKSNSSVLNEIKKNYVSELIYYDTRARGYSINRDELKRRMDTEDDVNSNLDAILKIVPDGLKGNRNYVEDIKGDLALLNYKSLYISENEAKRMGIRTDSLERFIFRAYQTGMPIIYKHLDDSILKSLVMSIILAITLVFLLLSGIFRSVKLGILSIIPIVLTIVILLGFMGLTNIPLDIATVMVASISIGIGIDYTIHFTSRYVSEIREGKDRREAISRTIRTTGVAILINAITVSLGFLTLLFAQLIPVVRFGILIALTMLISSLLSITFLPVLYLKIKNRRR